MLDEIQTGRDPVAALSHLPRDLEEAGFVVFKETVVTETEEKAKERQAHQSGASLPGFALFLMMADDVHPGSLVTCV